MFCLRHLEYQNWLSPLAPWWLQKIISQFVGTSGTDRSSKFTDGLRIELIANNLTHSPAHSTEDVMLRPRSAVIERLAICKDNTHMLCSDWTITIETSTVVLWLLRSLKSASFVWSVGFCGKCLWVLSCIPEPNCIVWWTAVQHWVKTVCNCVRVSLYGVLNYFGDTIVNFIYFTSISIGSSISFTTWKGTKLVYKSFPGRWLILVLSFWR